MADESNLATTMLRPQDIQAIAAGLAANPDAMATMACLMPLAPLPPMTSSQENPHPPLSHLLVVKLPQAAVS